MKIYVAIVDQKYEIQGVGTTEAEALKVAGQAWRAFWKREAERGGSSFYRNWKEVVEEGGVFVAELEPGKSYIDWEK